MKLVRDLIPKIIEESGRSCRWHKINNHSEYMSWLKLKIIEEADEFIEDPCLEEAADMLEVVKAFAKINNLDFEEVIAAAKNKTKKRGGFAGGIILEEVFDESR